jgi:eukaryotic-like serine/threonine-protein kinase
MYERTNSRISPDSDSALIDGVQRQVEEAEKRTAPHLEQIGRYRIIGVLGQGGMGIVYRAEQDNPKREVALKVTRLEKSSSTLLRRFEHEVEVLGRLQHPGIARIYEAEIASTSDSKQPYFAMELITGESVTKYAEFQDLGTRQRLALLVQVCEAVQHAHQKGVIHRDLKPSNILVDRYGQPKVLDFGVARATDSDVQVTTERTDMGQLIGTIPYMSPEQVQGDPAQLDTRSDVYALGVVGYKLLTGRLPYDVEHKTIPEAVRIISEVEATPLSSINRALRGDVDTIFAKALEKEKERRYQSAGDLAHDLLRYLANETIAARPASATYQIRKFARRNMGITCGMALAFAGLGIGLVVALWKAADAQESATQALIEMKRKDAVLEFVKNDIFGTADPSVSEGEPLTVREMLDSAARRLEGASLDPASEADLRDTVGYIYERLGFLELAESQLRRSISLWQEFTSDNDSRTLSAMNNLVPVLHKAGKYADAESVIRHVVGIQRMALGPDDPETIAAEGNLATVLLVQDKFEEAEPIITRNATVTERIFGQDHLFTISAKHRLADFLLTTGSLAEAERLARQALRSAKSTLPKYDPDTLTVQALLARILWRAKKFDACAEVAKETYEARRRVLGPQHTITLTSQHMLAVANKELGNVDEAISELNEMLQTSVTSQGKQNSTTILLRNSLAFILMEQDRLDEAENHFRIALESSEQFWGQEHLHTAVTSHNLAVVLHKTGRDNEAQPLAKAALVVRHGLLGDDHLRTRETSDLLDRIRHGLVNIYGSNPPALE